VLLTKQQHLDPNRGPKRILSLDGGGIRGVLTLEYLDVIETMLRERFKDPNLLLCDYFDLVGGTSTGSIIAAGLARGMTVEEIKKLYYGLGEKVFVPSLLRWGYLAPKFPRSSQERA
jgi:patatin-like phospholipase/acyl hydrolase